ncbi:MAG: endonuclease/exonuclease/phosphatase family protein [Bacteroidota bacterium]
MPALRKILFYLLIFLSSAIIVITLLSLFYNLSFWYSKILDFPRLQYFLLGILFLLFFALFNKKWNIASFFLLSGLLAVIVIHGSLIYPYLFGEKSVPDHDGKQIRAETSFDILIANVLISNRKSDEFIRIVKQRDPDILLAMEVDYWWMKELQVLKKSYPYQMIYPLDNAYGMSLYSKFPMENKEIKFLKHKDVPSFHAKIVLPVEKSFILHAVHPVAPVPSSIYPDNVGEEEIALLKIGELVARDSLASMVAGDFNDVSWSHTSRMFGKKGELENVRNGRGLYNTFDATSPILRWPLDHYFVTREFALVELERLPKFGSDHFPLYARFVLK